MRRKNKKLQSWLIAITIITILVIAFAYVIVKFMELPVDLPFMEQKVIEQSSLSDVQPIIDSWQEVKIYEPAPEPEPEHEPIVEEPVIILSTKFDSIIERTSLEAYVNAHPELNASTSWDYLRFDEVTKDNNSIGIKTTAGDDILALMNQEGVLVVGTKVVNTKDDDTENISLAKIAFVTPSSLELDVVEHLGYWEEIEKSADRTNALLSVNSSDYTWNETYNCGRITGLVKRNGDTIRKAIKQELVIGLDDNNNLVLGSNEIISGIEGTATLKKDNQLLIDIENDTSTKDARTAIGKLSDNTIMIVVVDGDKKHNKGANYTEILDIFNRYGATDVALMAGGNRSTLYFNGRIINNLNNTDEDGLKLPTTWIVKSLYNDTTTAEVEVQENTLNAETLKVE